MQRDALPFLIAVSIALAGCGGDDGDGAEAPEGTGDGTAGRAAKAVELPVASARPAV